jgi:two-component system cell cycle response regulator
MDYTKNQNLIPYLYEGVYVVDTHRMITYWNSGSERITGYSQNEVLHRYCYDNMLQHVDESGKKLCFEGCPLHDTIETGNINEISVFLKHKDGYRIPVMVKALPIFNDNGEVIAAIEVFTDERFQKDYFKETLQLKDELSKDPLTKIANRRYFDFYLNQVLDESMIFDQSFGMLIIDIDLFKRVNDTHGHLVGDEMLKVVANTLISNIHKNDIISRWGGEEFIGIFKVNDYTELLAIAERLRNVIKHSSFTTNDNVTINITVSIGGAIHRKNEDRELWINRADQNLYEAKNSGRDKSIIRE